MNFLDICASVNPQSTILAISIISSSFNRIIKTPKVFLDFSSPTLGVHFTVAILSILRTKNILDECNLPYQEYVDKGWFRVDTHTYQKKDSGIVKNIRVFVYKVGINNIKKLMKEYAGEKNGK